jgi:hypothetical protein
MSGEDAQTNDDKEYDEELSMVNAYRKAGGKISPAQIMRSLGKQRSLRIQEQRKKERKQRKEDEDKKLCEGMAKIDSIAFGILSVTMIVWTAVCMRWFFGKIKI